MMKVYLALEAGYTEKVREICDRYSLEGFDEISGILSQYGVKYYEISCFSGLWRSLYLHIDVSSFILHLCTSHLKGKHCFQSLMDNIISVSSYTPWFVLRCSWCYRKLSNLFLTWVYCLF